METIFFLNQHNFLITTGITLFFIYLRTELNYLSNDIILYGFVVVVYMLCRWTSQNFKNSLTPNKGRHPF